MTSLGCTRGWHARTDGRLSVGTRVKRVRDGAAAIGDVTASNFVASERRQQQQRAAPAAAETIGRTFIIYEVI